MPFAHGMLTLFEAFFLVKGYVLTCLAHSVPMWVLNELLKQIHEWTGSRMKFFLPDFWEKESLLKYYRTALDPNLEP